MLKSTMKTAVIIFASLTLLACVQKPLYAPAPVVGDEVAIDISKLKDLVPEFYSYEHKGKRYDFFVQSSGGEIAAYLDACFKCRAERKGFETTGKRLRCRSCGESFPLNNLSGIGSCYPISVQGKLRGNTFYIKTSTIRNKTKYPL